MSVMTSFSTAQVSRLTGISVRQLDHWDRQGFARPSLAAAAGYGSARRYSFEDVVRLRVASRLRRAGLGLAKIKRAMETLRRLDPRRRGMADVRLLLVGSRVVWARSDRQLVDLLREGQLMLVFPLGEELRRATAAVAGLSRLEADLLERAAPPARRGARAR